MPRLYQSTTMFKARSALSARHFCVSRLTRCEMAGLLTELIARHFKPYCGITLLALGIAGYLIAEHAALESVRGRFLAVPLLLPMLRRLLPAPHRTHNNINNSR